MYNLNADQFRTLSNRYDSIWATLFGIVSSTAFACAITAMATKVTDSAYAMLIAIALAMAVLSIITALLWFRDFRTARSAIVEIRQWGGYYVAADGSVVIAPPAEGKFAKPVGATIPTQSTATPPP